MTHAALRWSCSDLPPETVLANARTGLTRMRRWLAATPELTDGQRARRQRWREDRGRELAAAATLLRPIHPRDGRPLPSPLPRRVGQTGTAVDVATLDGPVYAAAAMAGLTTAQARRWLAAARRFRRVLEGRAATRCADAGAIPLAVVDRADGWIGLLGALHLSATPALLDAGAQVLGHVLRDAEWLADPLDALPPREDFTRRALTVALGLLGTAVPIDVACPDLRDAEDAGAWALNALTASSWAELDRRLQEGRATVGGAARDRLDVVQARVAMSNRLSALG